LKITLTTTGRTSGQPRAVSLYAFEDGDRLVIVGSAGGDPAHPAWVLNLRAEPRAIIRVGGEERSVVAHEVEDDGPERDRLWRMVTEAFRYYATYQRKTTRLIPLFVLETAADG
jgi:deazaflavin-dependent oxidoreductase (nitroreductase family)